MNKRTLKIVVMYLISFLCLVCFYYLETSSFLQDLMEESNSSITNEFRENMVSGLLKYTLLVIGASILLMTSFILIKEKFSKDN
jgi:hypothetical protein